MQRIFSGISMVIGIFHILENLEKAIYPWHFGISLEYPMSQKNGKNSMYRKFYGISQEYPISQRNRNFLCTGNFLGYTFGYPYPKNLKNSMYRIFLVYPWDIPYPENLKNSMYRIFFGISHIPIFCKTMYRGGVKLNQDKKLKKDPKQNY